MSRINTDTLLSYLSDTDSFVFSSCSTIAINGIGVILTFFVPSPDLDSAEMRDVSAPLHGKGMPMKEMDAKLDDSNI